MPKPININGDIINKVQSLLIVDNKKYLNFILFAISMNVTLKVPLFFYKIFGSLSFLYHLSKLVLNLSFFLILVQNLFLGLSFITFLPSVSYTLLLFCNTFSERGLPVSSNQISPAFRCFTFSLFRRYFSAVNSCLLDTPTFDWV